MAKIRKTHISTRHNKGETHDLTWIGLFLSVFYQMVMDAAVPVILSAVGTAWFSTVTIWVSGSISVCVVLCGMNLRATRLKRTVLMGAAFVSRQGSMQAGIMTSAWTERWWGSRRSSPPSMLIARCGDCFTTTAVTPTQLLFRMQINGITIKLVQSICCNATAMSN